MEWSVVFLFALLFCNVVSIQSNGVQRRSHLMSDLAEEQPRAFASEPNKEGRTGSARVTGRPLALPAGNRLVRKVVASADGKTEVGGPLSLWVNVTDNADTIKSCTWKSPDDVLFPVQPVAQGQARRCLLRVANLTLDQLGRWACKIQFNDIDTFRMAYFTATTAVRVTDVRLPRHLLPERYAVYLTPFLLADNFTIPGHVDIKINVMESDSKNITLHSQDMVVYENSVAVVDSTTGDQLSIDGFGYDDKRDFFIVFLKTPLSVGASVLLSIDFLGNLNDQLSGFYRSSYTDEVTNAVEYIATTQFEATDARRALPCFDEPAMKAKFQINLGRTKDRTSISNMPIEHESVPMADNDEYVWDQYQESLKMSTYLLAFVVSRFTYRQSTPRPNGVQFRIWSRNSAYAQTAYATDVGPRVLEFYEQYFNISFPLPKQDMIAIPDFSAGAMENWGLVTYREVALLYEPGKSTDEDREYVATVVAHELAHQWFGDLVTMEWWTDLWLNEGFASYMEYYGTAHVEPHTGILDRFPLESMYNTFKQDCLQTSHPISVPVNHPDEINEIFDDISYGKGASVIRMMANFLGLNTFIKGVSNYLNLHKFENARQDDLWLSLTDAAHSTSSLELSQSVKQIMDTWTLQMGFPVVTVTRSFSDQGSREQVFFAQERFLLTEDKTLRDDHDYKWWIPISYTIEGGNFGNTKNSFWILPTENNVSKTLDNLDTKKALIVNVQQTGFYRVNYDTKNWQLIINALLNNHTGIHIINRGQILDDSFNLARSGRLDYSTSLSLTKYLSFERDYIPWSAALSGFTYIETMFSKTGAFGIFRKYLIDELLPIFNLLGFETRSYDSFTDILLRKTVIKTICKLGYDSCTEKSDIYLRNMMRDGGATTNNTIPNNLLETVYCVSIANGGQSEWDFLWQTYLKSNNANEKSNILSALACSKDVWLLQRYLDMTIDPNSGIRKQDGTSVISKVASNAVGRYIVWDWIRMKWPIVSTYFDTAISSSVGKMISACTKTFNTDLELSELQQFYQKHFSELGTAKRDVEIAIQNTKANIEWMGKHFEGIKTWLLAATKNPKK